MTPDYQDIHARTCDKLIRQRAFWVKLARQWESELNYVEAPVERLVLQAKIDCIMRCAADMKYIATKSMENLSVDDIELISRINEDPDSKMNQLFAA